MYSDDENLIKVLRGNGVAVMPTDTIYGLVGRARNESAVNRIYALRKRNPKKACIILIGSTDELTKFSIIPTEEQKKVFQRYWSFDSSAVSIVLDCLDESLAYLHRGTNTLAFRLPGPKRLRDLLLEVGPLIAPSANTEAMPPSKNIAEAKKYFGDLVDLYVDGGQIEGKASKIIQLHKDGSVSILRE